MKIFVEGVGPAFKKYVTEVMENYPNRKFTYLPDEARYITDMVYETEDTDDDICAEVKQTIKEYGMYGGLMKFRVTIKED